MLDKKKKKNNLKFRKFRINGQGKNHGAGSEQERRGRRRGLHPVPPPSCSCRPDGSAHRDCAVTAATGARGRLGCGARAGNAADPLDLKCKWAARRQWARLLRGAHRCPWCPTCRHGPKDSLRAFSAQFLGEGVRAGGIFLPVRPAGKPRAHPKSPEKQHLLGLHT